MSRLRLAALWLVLFAAYAATVGTAATSRTEYGGDEPHHLLVAESIVSDGDLDLRDEYATRAYRDWYPGDAPGSDGARPGASPRAVLRPSAAPQPSGALHEPQGFGVGALVAPAYALGGPRAAEVLLAAIAALGFGLAAVVARRIVPEPWASGGAALVGLSPPALAHATAIGPGLAGGTLIAGAAACALALRERPRLAPAAGGATLLALAPWLDASLILPAAPVAVALIAWARRGRRSAGSLVPMEIILGGLVFYASLDKALFGGLTPGAAGRGDGLGAFFGGLTAGGAADAGSLADRLPRLAGMWLDRDAGLLRWAPVLALGFWAAWLLRRSRREGLSRALPARREAEAAAGLCVAVCVAQVVTVVIAAHGLDGPGFPAATFTPALPAAAALCAWGLQRARRTALVLGLLTLAASAWVLAAPSLDDLPDAPWGPLVQVLPRWGTGDAGEVVLTAAAAAAALALLVRESLRGRVDLGRARSTHR